jgi:hypothetical protein
MVGPELIGCDPGWRPTLFFQQLPYQLQRRLCIPLRLHEEIQNLALIVDGTPQPMSLPSDNDGHFIEVPIVAGRWSHMTQVSSNWRTKFEEPAPDALVGNIEAPLGKQILHISIAQGKPGVKPNRVANDVRWKAVAAIGNRFHLITLPPDHLLAKPINVTMPVLVLLRSTLVE